MHSRHSDGEWTPVRLVREARSAGLRAIALTDHDTLTGVAEAQEAGAGAGRHDAVANANSELVG